MKNNMVLIALPAMLMVAACDGSENGNRVVGELASDRIELAAEFAEPIVNIAVPEGTLVASGDVLLELNADRARARLAELDAALAMSQARLDELVRGPRSEQIRAGRANVEGAEQDLEFRASEYERVRELQSQGLASPNLLDRTKAALDAADANLELRRAQLQELLAGTTVEELAQADQAVKQATARRDSAAIDVERHTIRAPVNGVTDTRLFEIGERPNPGQPVMIMLGGEQPYARVFVPEALRVHIGTGTNARVFVDGLTAPLDGRVRWIASESAFTPYFALTERDRGRLSYIAKVDIVNERERLPDGVPVEVEFDLGSAGP